MRIRRRASRPSTAIAHRSTRCEPTWTGAPNTARTGSRKPPQRRTSSAREKVASACPGLHVRRGQRLDEPKCLAKSLLGGGPGDVRQSRVDKAVLRMKSLTVKQLGVVLLSIGVLGCGRHALNGDGSPSLDGPGSGGRSDGGAGRGGTVGNDGAAGSNSPGGSSGGNTAGVAGSVGGRGGSGAIAGIGGTVGGRGGSAAAGTGGRGG